MEIGTEKQRPRGMENIRMKEKETNNVYYAL